MSALLWKPTLAASIPADYDLNTVPYPVYASPKLDGVRALVQRGVLVSRNGRPIANTQAQAKFGVRALEGLDGELTAGAANAMDIFNATVRVTQKRAASADGLRFNVFDWCGSDMAFADRIGVLREEYAGYAGIYIVKQTLVRSAAHLLSYEAAQLALGYEGVMLRRADAGLYMQKRSTLREFNLVKLKRMEHSFAKLLAVYPLEHNKNESRTANGGRSSRKSGIVIDATQVGSALLKDTKSGAEFTVNVPTAALRTWIGWKKALGTTVRYRFQPVGAMNGVPRFPVADFKELVP